MSDIDGASAPADTGSIASNEPVIAATPNPISTEPRQTPAQTAEKSRQAEEAKIEQGTAKPDPKKDAEPVAEKAKPVSTREALRNAREKLEAESTKAADANVAPERATPLKDSPARAEDGKFVAKEPTKADAPKGARVDADKAVPDASKPVVDTKVAPDAKSASEAAKPVAPVIADKGTIKPPLPSYTAEPPPSRFSPDAKEAWAATPDPVRAEVHRAVKELTDGFEKHRSAALRDSEINEFHELATKGGTTVKEALSKYVNMENVLRQDTVKGLELICQNAGVSLREIAAHIMGQTPEQQASQSDALIREMRTEIADLKKQVGGVTQTFESQRTQTTQDQVAKFAADHPRFEDLAEDIAFFLKTRTKDLAEAYSMAERLNPAPAKQAEAEVPAASTAPIVAEVAKTIVTQDLKAQTLKGQKSVTGAPTAGSDPVRRQPSNSIRDALRKARAATG